MSILALFLLLGGLWIHVNATFWGVPTTGPRLDHCLVPYSTDLAVLFGGQNRTFITQNDIHLYNLTSNRWKTVVTFGTVPLPRMAHVCFVVNSTFYVFGGYAEKSYEELQLYDMYSLDVRTLTWTQRPSAPNQQGGPVGGVLTTSADIFIVFGGQPQGAQYVSSYTSLPCTSTTMLFYVHTQHWVTWTGSAQTPPARCSAAMVSMGNKVYLTGGSSYQPTFSSNEVMPFDMWQFDTTSLQWTPVAAVVSFPLARLWEVVVANPATSRIYLLGGNNGNGLTADVYVFDARPTNLSVSYLTSLPSPTLQSAGFFAQNAIWFHGGYDGSVVTTQLWKLDVTTLRLQSLSSIDDTISTQKQRIWYAATTYNNTWYIFGGATNTISHAVQDLVAFDLKEWTWSTVSQNGTIPPARFGHTFSTVGNRGIVFGGASSNYGTNFNDVHAFNFATRQWTLVITNGTQIVGRTGHTAVVYGQKLIIFAGGDCCNTFNDVWILDFGLPTPTWSQAPIAASSTLPGVRVYTVATLLDHVMYVFGGAGAVYWDDTWALDLQTWQWAAMNPTRHPPGLMYAAGVLMPGGQWYINGGLDSSSNARSDTWVYSIPTNTWTQIQTLDLNSPVPQPVYRHQGVASPYGDQLIVWGPGPGSTVFVTQILSPGFHQSSISDSYGSDVACQLDETQPCKTLTFALDRFAGASYLEFTVSGDMLNTFTITSSQVVQSMQFTVPVLIQGGTAGLVLDCQYTTCFTLDHVLANPFSLVNLVVRNGYAQHGSVITASDSVVSLQGVTLENNYASQQGGAIYLQTSTLNLVDVVLVNNTAALAGGAIYAYWNSAITAQTSQFLQNHAHAIGGAICVIATTLSVTDCTFSMNQVSVPASSSLTTFIAGGAIGATDCSMDVQSSVFRDNSIISSIAATYGGAIGSFTTFLTTDSVVFERNTAGRGGAVAALSIPTFTASMLKSVLQPSIVLLTNTSFLANDALESGGALYTSDTQAVVVTDCTVFNNSAQTFGGGWTATTTQLTVISSSFLHNMCWNGNGGALALLSSVANITASSFAWNISPVGGGGAIYRGSSVTTALSVASDVVLLSPILVDRQTLFAGNNRAAFGNTLASDPTSIASPYTTTARKQNASQAIYPAIVVYILDFDNHTVVVNQSAVTAYCSPPNALAEMGRVATSVNGRATFDGLIVRMPPGSTFKLWFTMGIFQTQPLVLTVDLCHAGSFYNVPAQRCDLCPLRETTFSSMQTECVPLNRPGDLLTWQADIVLVIAGLVLFGIFLCLASSRIRRLVDCIFGSSKMTGWQSQFRWIWFNTAIADVVQVIWMTQAVTISTTVPGASETLVTGLPWIYTFLVHFPIVMILHGIGLFCLRQGLVYQKANRKEKQKEMTLFGLATGARSDDATAASGIAEGGSGTNTSVETKDKSSGGGSGPLLVALEDRMVLHNNRRLRHLGYWATGCIALSGMCHFFASALNIWLCLYGAIQTSSWTMVLPDAKLFGYWLIPATVMLSLIIYARMRWDPRFHSWRRHLFSFAFAGLWFAIHWSVWLTQPLHYQPLLDTTALFWSTGSSPLAVVFVILCPIVLFPGAQLVISGREADLSNISLHQKNLQLSEDFKHVAGVLFHSGRRSALRRHMAIATSGGVRPHWIRFYLKLFDESFPVEDFNKPGKIGHTIFDDFVAHCKQFKTPTEDVFKTRIRDDLSDLSKPLENSGSSLIPSSWTATAAQVNDLLGSEAALQPFIQFCTENHDEESILAARDFKHYQAVLASESLSTIQAYHLAQITAQWWISWDSKMDALSGKTINISSSQQESIMKHLSTRTDLKTMFDAVIAELVSLVSTNQNQDSRMQKLTTSGIVPIMTRMIQLETSSPGIQDSKQNAKSKKDLTGSPILSIRSGTVYHVKSMRSEMEPKTELQTPQSKAASPPLASLPNAIEDV